MNAESRKIDIKSLSRQQLENWLIKRGEKSFKADQIFRWIYQHQLDSFVTMSNLNQKLRHSLNITFSINRLKIKSVKTSIDGSRKYAFNLSDGNIIESILIPEKNHYTLCVSSQVGCAQNCTFCMTSKSGLIRNLRSNEIIAQVRDIQKEVNTKCNLPLSNIVFMGMGEPLANYKQLIKALKIISNGSYGLKFSQRHITISTAGLVPKINLLGLDSKANLAISLNATDNKTRNSLMPINKLYPIETLIETCRHYPLKKRQKITFEYVLIKGVNDSISNARKLAILLKNVKAKINLIPFNEHSECKHKKPSIKRIKKFQNELIKKNYTIIIRHSKGADISGACGQLRSKHIAEIS